ncbi:hypothetical protein BLNAU_5174 [Blattamonas nauphoetae]|uniref:Uncharacterized protein n=1 Tax=Blattamonas nauphoetae TaxID=2049346 RepID=A0ABQ9Y8B2_9EUKA|nr:hypothetical protein BLNAU_5174 [Blattamonas nauphoetae]
MFTNEQPISDDDNLPTSSSLFGDLPVSDSPIPSFPKIRKESNKQPTIEIERDPPTPPNPLVSTKPRIAPTSFNILLFSTTTDVDIVGENIFGDEITIALELPDTATILSAIRSTLSETIPSLESSFFCPQWRDSSELSTRDNSSDFSNNDEFRNQNR